MPNVVWHVEHTVEVGVSADFAWRFWTNVSNWDDPPAEFVLDGPFVAGSIGMTLLPGRDPLQWRIHHVLPGRSATIEMELDRATLSFTWRFDAVSDRQSYLTQRVVLSGDNAAAYTEQVRAGFGSTLPGGMNRVAAAMVRSAAGNENGS
jgi:hypothetical protein